MQKLLIQALCATAVFSAAFPAFAAGSFRATAVLETAAASSAAVAVEGVDWTCKGAYCSSAPRKVGLDSVVKECRKTAAVLGPVKAYTTRGRELTKGDLKACNKTAAEAPTEVAGAN